MTSGVKVPWSNPRCGSSLRRHACGLDDVPHALCICVRTVCRVLSYVCVCSWEARIVVYVVRDVGVAVMCDVVVPPNGRR